jgi:hypothetical protein
MARAGFSPYFYENLITGVRIGGNASDGPAVGCTVSVPVQDGYAGGVSLSRTAGSPARRDIP